MSQTGAGNRWQKLERLFLEAAALPPSDRPAFLAQHCAGDPDLRVELEALLSNDDPAGDSFLGDIVQQEAASAVRPSERRIGPYLILETLGAGGMGTVYRASRDDGVYQKDVAIKVLQFGLDSPQARERFRMERQILASLEHPGIARLIDGGQTDSGLPYIVLEYVAGETLMEYCEARNLTRETRLRLFLEVCAAVQHAHQALIVHRDLKPANILVTGEGRVKLLDFGIAKLLDQDAGATLTMQPALTPNYASPEQVRGEAITTATDVYSLGVVLYELLTGRRPYQVTNLSPAEILRAVCRTEAPPAGISGDLDNILAMALRKEPQRRYASVREFAEDIERSMSSRPVKARPDTLRYRAGKFARRNRVSLAAVAAVILALAGGLLAALYEARLANTRFQDVRSLANSFLFDFDKEISAVPGNTRARQMLAATAQRYLDKLSATAGNDQPLLEELATSYEKLGDVQGSPGQANLGQSREAWQSYDKAIAILERLSGKNPKLRPRLAIDLSKSGRIAIDLNQTDLAIERSKRAAQLADQIHAESPSDFNSAVAAARIYFALSVVERQDYRCEEAIEAIRRAVALYRAVPPNSYPNVTYLYSLALMAMGNASRQLAEFDTARNALTEALEIQNGLLSAKPADITLRAAAVSAYETLASSEDTDRYPSHGDRGNAVAQWRKAIEIVCAMADADPNDLTRQSQCALDTVTLAFVALRRNAKGDAAEADDLSRSGVARLDAIFAKASNAGLARNGEPFMVWARALVLAQQGKREEAVRLSQRALDAERAVVRKVGNLSDARLDLAGQLTRHARILTLCGQPEAAALAVKEAATLFDGLSAEMKRWMSYAYQAGAYRMELAQTMESVAEARSAPELRRAAAAAYEAAAGSWALCQAGRPYVQQRLAEANAGRDRCRN